MRDPSSTIPSASRAKQPSAKEAAILAALSIAMSAKVQRVEGPPPLLVKRLRPDATLPVRGSALAAGYDLAAAEGLTVPARGKAVVSTGLSVAIPEDCYGRIGEFGSVHRACLHPSAEIAPLHHRCRTTSPTAADRPRPLPAFVHGFARPNSSLHASPRQHPVPGWPRRSSSTLALA